MSATHSLYAGRNLDKRVALNHKISQLKKEREAWSLAFEDAHADLDDDAFDALFDKEWAERSKPIRAMQQLEFQLAFPSVRDVWFRFTFIPSFGLCEGRRISAKQADIIARYCEGDADEWRSNKVYCIVDDKFVTLFRMQGWYSVSVETMISPTL